MSFKATSREVGGRHGDRHGRADHAGRRQRPAARSRSRKLDKGHKKIVMNLAGINYIDSTGLGELVSGYRLVKSQGGELKLLNLNKKVTRPSANHQAVHRVRHPQPGGAGRRQLSFLDRCYMRIREVERSAAASREFHVSSHSQNREIL